MKPANPDPPSPRAVVSEYLQEEPRARLAEHLDVRYDPDLYADRPRLFEALEGAEAILVRNRTRIDAELLARAPHLRVVGRLGVGLDNIDLDACESAGVRVFPAYGANAVSVAEYVFGALLALVRPVFDMTPSMVAGQWPRQGIAFGRELMGMTLGLVGYGAISRHVASRAAAFEMRVLAHDPFVDPDDPAWGPARPTDLVPLLRESDVVSMHVPLTEATRSLIDADTLVEMKPGAVLINTSRGGTVDEAAVADALRSGALGGAALDVFASEPLGPEAGSVFEGLDRLILTPHVAGNTEESVARVARVTVDSVLAALQEDE